jgi:hypothetical protein
MKSSGFYNVYRYPPKADPALRREIEDLRYRGHRGGYILNHRALLTSRRGRWKWGTCVVLSLGLFLGWLYAVRWVTPFWADIMRFWNDALGMGGYVTLIHYQLANIYDFKVPYLHVTSAAPDYLILLAGWIVTVILFIASFFLPRHNLPLIYGVRVILLFHLCAQVFFTFMPLSFPYGAAGYVHGVLIAGLALISLIPLLMGFTYFVFDYAFWRKVGLTLLIMAHLVVFIPTQFAAHAFILHHSSLLFLPVLFFGFGLALDVMIFIGFYSWGASWRNDLYREDIRPEAGR